MNRIRPAALAGPVGEEKTEFKDGLIRDVEEWLQEKGVVDV